MSSSIDLSRLAKVLALMSSSSDGEALAAARRATAMLDVAGLTWSDVLTVTAEAALAPVQVCTQRDGMKLVPPIGRTWLETVRWFLIHDTAIGTRDRRMLERLVIDLQSPFGKFISPDHAARICRLYASLTPAS